MTASPEPTASAAPTGTEPSTVSDGGPVREEGGVLRIAVSTASAGTSLDPEALSAGTQALHEVARGEREVGAILLAGDGPNFCAGGNVRAFAAAEHRPDYLRALADTFHAFVQALLAADRPVVAEVSGWAAGAGLSLVLHADIAVGGASTRLRPAYLGIGLSPDGGMSWTLPRAVGAARARRIILTDEVIAAGDALAWGVLSDVVDDAEVATRARQIADRLATGPRGALAATRRLLTASATSTLPEQLAAESLSISTLSGTPEGIEGVDAFVGKRRPDFGAVRGS